MGQFAAIKLTAMTSALLKRFVENQSRMGCRRFWDGKKLYEGRSNSISDSETMLTLFPSSAVELKLASSPGEQG